MSDTLDEKYTDGYKHGQGDLNHLIKLLKSVRNALKPGGDIAPYSTLDKLGQELEQTIELYSKQYSDKSEEPKNRDVLKSSSRVGVKDLDFLAYLDLYAREEHAVEDWHTLSMKVSPEAFKEIYIDVVKRYTDYLRVCIGK